MSKPKSPDDEFLGYIAEASTAPRGEKEDERDVRIGFLAELMTLAEEARGIHLERLVKKLEAHCIQIALEKHNGDPARAALWLGLRSTEALQFMLQRHPTLTYIRKPQT